MKPVDPQFYLAQPPRPDWTPTVADLTAAFSGPLQQEMIEHIANALHDQMLDGAAASIRTQRGIDPRSKRRARFSNSGSVYEISILHDDPLADRLDELFPNLPTKGVFIRPVSDRIAMELQLLFRCEPVDKKSL